MDIKNLKTQIKKDPFTNRFLCFNLKNNDLKIFKKYFRNDILDSINIEFHADGFHIDTIENKKFSNLTRLMILDQIEMIKNNKIIL